MERDKRNEVDPANIFIAVVPRPDNLGGKTRVFVVNSAASEHLSPLHPNSDRANRIQHAKAMRMADAAVAALDDEEISA